MKPIAIYSDRWSISGDIMLDLYINSIFRLCCWSVCISENLLTLCMCTAMKFIFNLNISFTNRCTVDQWLMLVGNQLKASLLEADTANHITVVLSSS